ncbi:MAG: AraC family transcriptional regulator [Desulfosporosinus sp.]|nr:AraC family transcriptional regulator [Desulfosporosinus sp.]
MEWLDKMNSAIKYIEENLAGDIDIKAVAKIVVCSEYQFQRMFAFITDVPLSEYIRRRRHTLAAFELQRTDAKVIDLALKYGYDSPISFSRAFRKLHGVTPTTVRRIGTKLKAYPPISFHISVKGDVETNYRIEEKQAFSVFGVEEIFSTENDADKSAVPEFWTRNIKNGTVDCIREASGIRWDTFSRGTCPVNAVMVRHVPK